MSQRPVRVAQGEMTGSLACNCQSPPRGLRPCGRCMGRECSPWGPARTRFAPAIPAAPAGTLSQLSRRHSMHDAAARARNTGCPVEERSPWWQQQLSEGEGRKPRRPKERRHSSRTWKCRWHERTLVTKVLSDAHVGDVRFPVFFNLFLCLPPRFLQKSSLVSSSCSISEL